MDRAIDREQVLAIVLFDGAITRLFRRRARRGLQRVLIVERDRVEDQVLERGALGARDRLGAAGALLERQPDDGGSPGLLDRRRDLLRHRRRQRHPGRRCGAKLEERAARYSAAAQIIAYQNLAHVSPCFRRGQPSVF
jgi:hypothetical protein